MNICVVYFSRTGNTKQFAQAIADTAKAQLFDIASTEPSGLESCDLLILGTPVEGASPAKETLSFIEKLPNAQSKKAILFSTYKVFGNMRTMKFIEKKLADKGYSTLAMVSKKGMEPNKPADFSKELNEVKKALEKI